MPRKKKNLQEKPPDKILQISYTKESPPVFCTGARPTFSFVIVSVRMIRGYGLSLFCRYRPKGVFGKGVGNSKNASEMRQKCVKMGLVLLGQEERSKMRQKSVKIASKMRGTPLGENTFWTIPILVGKAKGK